MHQVFSHSLIKHIKRGKVYRRADLEQYSTAIDRDLQQLCSNKEIFKLSHGLYYRPKQSVFGPQSPEDKELVRSFLKDTRFLMTSFNHFNSLGLGFTQLYNNYVVYNYKRHGRILLGSKIFEFKRVSNFPKKLSKEFLLVDLLNNLKSTGEENRHVLLHLRKKISEFDSTELVKVANKFGRAHTHDLIKNIYDSSQTLSA